MFSNRAFRGEIYFFKTTGDTERKVGFTWSVS